jgi:hypothetical protein
MKLTPQLRTDILRTLERVNSSIKTLKPLRAKHPELNYEVDLWEQVKRKELLEQANLRMTSAGLFFGDEWVVKTFPSNRIDGNLKGKGLYLPQYLNIGELHYFIEKDNRGYQILRAKEIRENIINHTQ